MTKPDHKPNARRVTPVPKATGQSDLFGIDEPAPATSSNSVPPTASEPTAAPDDIAPPAAEPPRSDASANPGDRIRPIASIADIAVEDRPATLADAMDFLDAKNLLPPETLRRMRADLNTAAAMTATAHNQLQVRQTRQQTLSSGRRAQKQREALARLPCDPLLLRPILGRVLPARFIAGATILKPEVAERRRGAKRKRWSNIRATVGRVLVLTGWADRKDGCQEGLAPDWRAAADHFVRGSERAVFGAFARFCFKQELLPVNVTESVLADYEAWRRRRTLDIDPRETASRVRHLWNRLCREMPAWPGSLLRAPGHPKQVVQAEDKLTPEFLADLEDYLANLAKPKPLQRKFPRPLAQHTIVQRRGILLRAAAIVNRTRSPQEPLVSLREIVTVDAINTVLLEHYDRVGKGCGWAPSSMTVASTLSVVASQWGTLSDQEMLQIKETVALVKRPKEGLSAKNRRRIGQFDQSDLLERLSVLPRETFRLADQTLKNGDGSQAAILHENALAMAIILEKPLRRKNLVNLNVERHVFVSDDRRVCRIMIPASEAKTPNDLDFSLSPELTTRLDRHVDIFRPLLQRPTDNGFLFPGMRGGAMNETRFAHRITQFVKNQLGTEFNIHLIRHILATLMIDADPNNVPALQKLLGHGQKSVTERMYGVQRSRAAQVLWMNILHEKRQGGRHK